MSDRVVKATHLRCEYLVDPLGIDELRPRLGWMVEGEGRGRRQTAWRVLVAGSAEKLAAGAGDLWDSGKVRSDQTAHVEYAGTPLRSRTRCFWKVRVWDERGRASAWSEPARWTVGLLREADWRALWIGYDRPAAEAVEQHGDWRRLKPAKPGRKHPLVLPPARYVRKEFALGKPVRRATVYATALGLYELRINGRRVGQDWFTPGWTDYDKRIGYRTYDVTGLVRRGANAIGAILADGWYAGYIGWFGHRDVFGDKLRLRAQLEVVYEDGTRETIPTNRTWRAATGPIREADFLMGQAHDARREMPGWDGRGFDDGEWDRVNATRRVAGRLRAATGVPVRALAELRPVKRTEPKPGRFVFDLGQNVAGVVRLRVRGARRGRKIVLRFAERLCPDGTVYVKNLRSARATDTYVCRGGSRAGAAEETWQPQFTFHGFRYVEVTGYPGRPRRDAITGVALGSDTPDAGHFDCSDRAAGRLWHNIRWTQRANFLEVPTDCPQRDERMGWTGDAQIFCRTAAWSSDVAAFFTKWLADLADAQGPGGEFPDVAPRRVVAGGGTAAWSDAGVLIPWTMYRVYGDERLLRRHYRSMARHVAFCKRHSEGLLRPAKGYGDWLNIRADTPRDVLATAYFARCADVLSRAAGALGKRADAARWRRLFERIRRAFGEAYVGEDGRVKGDTQTAYVLALAFDLLPEELRPAAVRRLVDDIRRRKGHLSTGIVGTKDLMDVLTAAGRLDVAWRLFHNRTLPSWGFMVRQGATTIWERWDGWTPDRGFQTPQMNSFNHYALGSVGQWMFPTITGIDAAEAGFRRIVIRPRPGGRLKWAKARYDSLRGRIVSEWERTPRGLEMRVEIPANTTAAVHVPSADAAAVTEGARPAAKAQGVRYLRMEGGAAVYHVGSGRYRFVSRGWRP